MYQRANQRLLGEHTQGQIMLQNIYKAFFNTEFLLFLFSFSFLSCLRYQWDYSNDAIQTHTQITYILCFIQNSQDWSHHERTPDARLYHMEIIHKQLMEVDDAKIGSQVPRSIQSIRRPYRTCKIKERDQKDHRVVPGGGASDV